MTDAEKYRLLKQYSKAELAATDLRRLLGDITYADVIIELAQHNLPLPQAPQAGREAQIARARELLFPSSP